MLFLFVTSSFCTLASSGPFLTNRPLPLASVFATIQGRQKADAMGSSGAHTQGTFTPLVHAHAGRTQLHRLDWRKTSGNDEQK